MIVALVLVGIALAVLCAGAIMYWMLGGLPGREVKTVLVYEVDQTAIGPDWRVDMQQLRAAVDRRLNVGWQARARVRVLDDRQIEIGLYDDSPENVAKVTRLATMRGTLEFRILANERDHPDLIERANTMSEGEPVLFNPHTEQREAWWVPVAPGREDAFSGDGYDDIPRRARKTPQGELLEILVVDDQMEVTGEYIDAAAPGVDYRGRPCVNFRFNSEGAGRFERLTGNNLPDEPQNFFRKLGIILDGRLHSAPRIISTISRRGEITGDFTLKEAETLAHVLNAGALPAPIRRVK